jgi:malonate transporter
VRTAYPSTTARRHSILSHSLRSNRDIDPGTARERVPQLLVTGILTGFAVVGLAIGLGYVLGRQQLLGEHARFVLSRLTFFVLSPFLLFVVLAEADIPTLFSALLPVSALTAITMFAVYALLARLLWRRGLGDTVVGALGSGYVNANNIGIPIALYLLGNAAFSAPVILAQLLVFMPIALVLLDASTSTSTPSVGRIVRQTVRNPMLIGAALGVVVALTGIQLPPVVWEPIALIAGACVPILLISYGLSLPGARVLTAKGRRRDILLASGLKLIAMPLVAWLLGQFVFALPRDQVLAVVVLAALPVAQNVFNFAQRYDVGERIARDTIFLTTIGCIPVLLVVALLLS